MKKIKFNRTSNVFINSGIIALNYYLEKYKNEFNFEFSFSLNEDFLEIESDNLYNLLEDIYYKMGKEVYDTSGKKARKKPDKYYFIEDPFEGVPFYKMFSYGIAGLITNNPTPSASPKGKSINFDKLFKENYTFADKVARLLVNSNKKLKFYSLINEKLKENERKTNGKRIENTGGESKIFINDSYTKITILPKFDKKYFQMGNEKCCLTGETFDKLIDIQNTSPFIAGLNTFESYSKIKSKKISWKAMYLSRFSPKIGLYSYVQGLDFLQCYFFETSNLINLKKIYDNNRSFYKLQDELIESNYMSNFNIYNFHKSKAEDKLFAENKDFTECSEILFILIYTFYKQCLSTVGNNVKLPFAFDLEKIPEISLVSFSAKKFASTMRPESYEVFNDFKYIIKLIEYLEKNGVSFKSLFSSLKFLKKADKENANKYRLERQTRNEVFKLILEKKSILKEITKLMYGFYSALTTGGNLKFKNYTQITKLTFLYEPIIKYGGNKSMNKEIQEMAIKLGVSIGIGITKFDNGNPKENAKNGRKYAIGLSKSRTLLQFLSAIERIENKYHIILKTGFLESLNEENWEYIKQFTIVSALSNLNIALSNKNNKEN